MLTFENVSASAGDVRILHDIFLRVPRGELVALLGPNGCGKSSLLRTAYRSFEPAAGVVWIDGLDVWRSKIRNVARKTGVVIQRSESEFPLTVWETVLLGRSPRKRLLEGDTADDLEKVESCLDHVGLSKYRDRLFTELSGGEQQRVMLAQALAVDPKVLILDEPTNHLDLKHQYALLRLVKGLEVTTITALHDLNLAARFADEVAVLKEGRLVTHGEPGSVLRPDLIKQVFDIDVVIGLHPVDGSPLVIVE